MSKTNKIEELTEDMEVIGPGQILSEAREKAGLTQQQVAEKLNFRTTLVNDIENDIFDRTLPSTFNRGYLKNYAKLVNISEEEVLSGFETLNVAEKQGAEMQSFSKETEKQAETNLVMWISYLILAFLIGSTILWWLQDLKATKPATANNASVKTSQPNKNTPLVEQSKDLQTKNVQVESSLSNNDENNVTNTSKSISESTSVNDESQTVIDEEKTATLAETLKAAPINDELNNDLDIELNKPVDAITPEVENNNTASTHLSNNLDVTSNREELAENNTQTPIDFGPEESVIFSFSGDCWVNIYDATGERIAWGIKKLGYEMNITGQAPFDITLGKPELVAITFENKDVDMTQFSRGNIAKFTLPLE